MPNYSRQIAEIALKIKAIKLQPKDPFTWTSGYRMPIYNDNRMLLGAYEHRAIIVEGFLELLKGEKNSSKVIAGTATAGIAPATSLADRLHAPLIYVRAEAKGHGLGNRIEGRLTPGEEVLLIEDLISTGKSSISALLAIREAGAKCNLCLSIFNYGFKEAQEQFASEACKVLSLLNFENLLEVAVEKDYITGEQRIILADWQSDPLGWGEKNGFSRKLN